MWSVAIGTRRPNPPITLKTRTCGASTMMPATCSCSNCRTASPIASGDAAARLSVLIEKPRSRATCSIATIADVVPYSPTVVERIPSTLGRAEARARAAWLGR